MHLIAVVPHILLQNRALAWCCRVESPHVMLQKCTLTWSVLTFCSKLVLSFGASSGSAPRSWFPGKQENTGVNNIMPTENLQPCVSDRFLGRSHCLWLLSGVLLRTQGLEERSKVCVHAHTKFRGLPKKRQLRTHGWRPSLELEHPALRLFWRFDVIMRHTLLWQQ